MVIQTYPCALPLPTYLFSLFKLKHQYTEPHSMQLSTTKGPDFANFNGRDTKIPNSLSLDTPVTIKQTRNFQKLAALASYRIMKAPSLPPPGRGHGGLLWCIEELPEQSPALRCRLRRCRSQHRCLSASSISPCKKHAR